MRKKIVALILLLLLALFVAVNWLLSGAQLERIANYFLAPDFSLQIAQQPGISMKNAQIPSLIVRSERGAGCSLVELQNVRADWWNSHKLAAESAVLDYACLNGLPSDNTDEKTSQKLTALLALLPDGEAQIQRFQLMNTEPNDNPELQQILSAQANISLQKQQGELRLKTELEKREEGENAGILQLDSVLRLSDLQLTGEVSYQPTLAQTHQLNFQLKLNDDPTQLPPQGEVKLHWERAELPLPKGEMALQWKDGEGRMQVQDLVNQKEIMNLPLRFQSDQIQIEKGNFYWDMIEQQPLQGVLSLTLKKTTEDWLPLKTDVRVSLFSSGAQGKGNVVIYGTGGEIGKEQLNFPLEAHGNIKYGESIAYTDMVFKLSGFYYDPIVQFQTPSMLRVTGRGHELSLNVSVPLDNVLVGRYGVEGRLQAFLQGSTTQFSDLDLRLDGQAEEFIAGITSIFDIRSTDNPLYRTQDFVANSWQWNLSGKGIAKALNTSLNIRGRGSWVSDHIEIEQLEGYSGQINKAGVRIPKVELKLADKLRWYYEEQRIDGKMQASAPYIELAYGGRFYKPDFILSLEGKDITDFNLAGELTAGELGPIKVFSHYYDQKLVGNIYWLEQSAKVFQSLFPNKWEWLIQEGTIRGQTAFDITTEKGIHAGGHFAIRAGDITLPDGEIRGIEFALPYRYVNNAVEMIKEPVQVFVKQIKMGVLQADNLRVKVQGYYPYSRKRPLNLSELEVDLFGGKLSINRLALPQRNIADVQLQEIDLAQVLSLLQYNQIEMTGKINATFPFWLSNDDCLICNGKIQQAENIRLKLNDEIRQGLKQGGVTEGILADVINEMDLQAMDATLNLAPDGKMELRAQVRGYNPTKKTQSPISLNYNHQENVYELWQMIDYGSQVEQNLEYNIYRKQEK